MVELVKAAFIAGLLTRGELGQRVGGALTARTHADLARVSAGIPASVAAPAPPAPGPASTARRPGARAKAGACLIAATAMMLIDAALTGSGAGPSANGFYVLSIMAFVVAFVVWLCTLVT